MVENRRIQRIIDYVGNINAGQICIEPTDDSDLGFPIFAYKDDGGVAYRALCKDEPGRLQYLDLIANGHECIPGRLCYDSATNGLTFGLSTDVQLNIGEEFLFRARNTSGAQINNGLVCALTGASGTNPTIGLADSSTSDPGAVLGVATENITNNGFGYVTEAGHVRELNMSAFSVGDDLWLGSSGALQNTQPNAPLNSVYIGLVLDDSATQGELLARVRPIPKLWELSDVDRSTALSDGDVYVWVDANDRFELTTLLTADDVVTSLDVDGLAGGPLQGDLKFYTSANVFIDKAVDGFIFSFLSADTIYLADSVTLTTGTYVSGTVDDTHTVNQVGYTVQEVASTPGYDVRLNYSSVNAIDRLQMHIFYDAVSPPGHTVSVQLYNYNTTAFVTFTTFTTSAGYQTIDLPIADDTNYIDGSGNAIMRFYHAVVGSITHEIVLDYAVLVEQSGGGGAQAVLAQNAIGFGSATNVLTGDATNFRYVSANRQMLLGPGTPAWLTVNQDSLFVAGQIEITGDTHFSENVYAHDHLRLDDATYLVFGDGSDVAFEWSTVQTVDSFFTWLPSGAPSFNLAPASAIANNYALSAHVRPTLVLWSNNASLDNTERFELAHTSSHARLLTLAGSFEFRDEYLTASANWTTNNQRLYDSSTEVDNIYALLGSTEGSIAAAILAAAATGGSGGTLDAAYDFGGAGAGRQITATAGAVAITNAGENDLLLLTASAGTSDLLEIANNAAVGSRSVYMTGTRGIADFTLDGHVIESNGAAKYLATFGSVGQAYIHYSANTSSDFTSLLLRAEDDTQNFYSLLSLSSTDGVVLTSSTDIYLYATGANIYAPNSDIWADSLQKNITSGSSTEHYLFMRANVDTNDYAIVRVGFADCGGIGTDAPIVYLESFAQDNDNAVIYARAHDADYDSSLTLNTQAGGYCNLIAQDDTGTTYARLACFAVSGSWNAYSTGTMSLDCGSALTLIATTRVDFTSPIVDINEGVLTGLQVTEYTDAQAVTATASSNPLSTNTYDWIEVNLNNGASRTFTLQEPSSGVHAKKTIQFTQGGSTPTTSFTWATSGTSNVLWDNETEPSWPTGTGDVFYVSFVWDGTNFYGMGTGSFA